MLEEGAAYLASYAAFPLLLLLGDDVREERGNEALLERVDQEEGRRDQGNAVCRVRVGVRVRVKGEGEGEG